ncbi:hypothetical protein [Microbacterium cremeum]|uniref:hypothetical protein n=1 Tax=Microbacterium cremeum TaxID=2782169 RepID=UPI0018897F78|nr:hypothetical protein [Microbacterium cremeum]
MEAILLIVSSWWWVAPAAAGVGAVSYAGLTTRSRRARRLELDAARHEESRAYRELVAAKARVRAAHADLLSAKAHGGGHAVGARHALQSAKQSEKSASLALRATRSRVKGVRAEYVASSSRDPLPIDRLYAAHDAVNARWLTYETDVDKALAFPQLTDTRHPSTVTFLRAQREALARRPMLRDRVSPQQYAEYRAAVQALEAALTEAERQAGVPGSGPAPASPAASAAAAAVTAAANVSAAAAALADLAGRLPELLAKPPAARGGDVPPDRAP